MKNVRFLEEKLSTNINEREDQIIKLKSEIVIYKNKLVSYKTKLRKALDGVETKRISELQATYVGEIQKRDENIKSQETDI